MATLELDPASTALILIDLQQGIVGRAELAPHSGADVVRRSAELAARFRAKGAMVVYVRVDVTNFLVLPVDRPMRDPNAPPPDAAWSELVPEAGRQPGDLVSTKRQWGAFFGTDLEAQLRARGIRTIVLGGISTNYGVESTARAAAGLGFALIVVEDATASSSAELHRFPYEHIFPRLGRVRSTAEVLAALA
jgi:nicotinamidase-related amidase